MPVTTFHNHTLSKYLDGLAAREPVPGGGSAAALTAALGAALVCMVANYSLGRKVNTKATEKRLAKILKDSQAIRRRLLALTSLDSQAYLKVAAARKLDVNAQKKAARQAADIGLEVCRLCYKTLCFTPFLVAKGNPYLISDVEAAAEFLLAGFNASMVMVRINQ